MIDAIRDSDVARFWNRVDLTPTPEGCLLWTGGTSKGYGRLRWKNDRMIQATHVAWELATGAEPQFQILHHCDNRLCVAFEHLHDGTQSLNVFEMHDRNPNCQAELAHGRRLIYAQVDAMRRLYRTGEWSSQRLGALFGVAQTVALDAITGRSYPRGPSEPPVPAMGRGRVPWNKGLDRSKGMKSS